MATVLERLARLIALSESPNEHEARNAALLATRLIRQHGIIFAMPESPARRATPAAEQRRRTPGRASSGRSKRVADVPTEIKSPLGGDCIECGGRYRAGSTVYWMESGGGMHPRCFEAWLRRR
jgi:hypothetical protein